MPRTTRVAPKDWIFHVLNRSNGRSSLFDSPACYGEFLQILKEAARLDSMRILAYCAMPNHWHLLLWPRGDGDLSRFVQRVSVRHTHRWHERHKTTGHGHLYQGRFKSFAVRSDRHLVTVCRYIERNPLRANLVDRAESWPWSSAAMHVLADPPPGTEAVSPTSPGHTVPLAALPVELPRPWAAFLHEPQTQGELDAMRACLRRGVPYGDAQWQSEAAARLGLRAEAGRRGRPPKLDNRHPTSAIEQDSLALDSKRVPSSK